MCRAISSRWPSRSAGRHERRHRLAPEDVGPRAAEDLLRGVVEVRDPALVVHGDDAVEGGLEDRHLPRFAGPELRFPLRRLLAGHVVADGGGRRGIVGVHEGLDALARVLPPDEEAHAAARTPFDDPRAAHDLADDPDLSRLVGQLEPEVELHARPRG